MIHLLTIVGARPQIIKAAATSRSILTDLSSDATPFSELVSEDILHTGQHYDSNMSANFFSELNIQPETYNLHVGSATHGQQTARMITGIEQVLESKHYDGVLLFGDTNSTIAGAIAAGKMGIAVYHVEAGLRSFDMLMPEEQNRIVCDHLSQLLFAPTQTAVNNLRKEGLTDSPALFNHSKQRQVFLTGDVMYDNAIFFSSMAEKKSTILTDLQLAHRPFILSTIHRNANTDDPHRLLSIMQAIIQLSEEGIDIVLPLHPRTTKMLKEQGNILNQLSNLKNIHLLEPLSFFDILMLEKHAALVITDSGGVQKESFFFSTPSVILRRETEWTEIIEAGAGELADADTNLIINAAHSLLNKKVVFPPLFGDSHAAKKIIQHIIDNQ